MADGALVDRRPESTRLTNRAALVMRGEIVSELFMAEHSGAARPGHPHTRVVHRRLTAEEYAQLLELTHQAGARTHADYLRELVFRRRRRAIEVTPRSLIAELINEMDKVAAEINQSPPGPAKDRAIESATDAFDRITP
jgi:hypothetical protein